MVLFCQEIEMRGIVQVYAKWRPYCSRKIKPSPSASSTVPDDSLSNDVTTTYGSFKKNPVLEFALLFAFSSYFY